MTVPETVPEAIPEVTSERRFVWPCTYYSTATPAAVLPPWATYGCGAAALFILAIVFAGGAYLAGSGFTDFMDLALGMSVAEMKNTYTPDVSAERKKTLDTEIETMRKNLRDGAITGQSLQPFLEALRRVSSDNKVTAAEAATLEEAARKANATAKRR